MKIKKMKKNLIIIKKELNLFFINIYMTDILQIYDNILEFIIKMYPTKNINNGITTTDKQKFINNFLETLRNDKIYFNEFVNKDPLWFQHNKITIIPKYPIANILNNDNSGQLWTLIYKLASTDQTIKKYLSNEIIPKKANNLTKISDNNTLTLFKLLKSIIDTLNIDFNINIFAQFINKNPDELSEVLKNTYESISEVFDKVEFLTPEILEKINIQKLLENGISPNNPELKKLLNNSKGFGIVPGCPGKITKKIKELSNELNQMNPLIKLLSSIFEKGIPEKIKIDEIITKIKNTQFKRTFLVDTIIKLFFCIFKNKIHLKETKICDVYIVNANEIFLIIIQSLNIFLEQISFFQTIDIISSIIFMCTDKQTREELATNFIKNACVNDIDEIKEIIFRTSFEYTGNLCYNNFMKIKRRVAVDGYEYLKTFDINFLINILYSILDESRLKFTASIDESCSIVKDTKNIIMKMFHIIDDYKKNLKSSEEVDISIVFKMIIDGMKDYINIFSMFFDNKKTNMPFKQMTYDEALLLEEKYGNMNILDFNKKKE